MQHVIFNHYVNEFGAYVFIPQRVFHGVLLRKRENAATLPNSAQRKHVFWVLKGKCQKKVTV